MTHKPILRLVWLALLAVLVSLSAWLFNLPASGQEAEQRPENSRLNSVQFQGYPDRIASAPGSSVRFDHLTIEDGLSQNASLAVLQDSHGYLWIGSQDGLNRYDGYRITIFKHDPNNTNSLSYNSIIALAEDSQAQLWIGTWGGGLDQFDPHTNQFTHYSHQPDQPDSLSHDLVSAVLPDSYGNLWVGTLNGLDRLDPVTGRFTHYRNDPADPNSLSSNVISRLYEDRAGNLWVGTGAYNLRGGGLNRFDRATQTFVHYRHDPAEPNSLAGDNISGIAEDASGALWVATGGYGLEGAGLDRLDLQTGQVKHFQNRPGDSFSLSDDNILSIMIDLQGYLWVGTQGGGLNRLDLNQGDGRFTRFRHDPSNLHSLSQDSVWTMYEDRSGVLWFGTLNGGLSKLNRQTEQFGLYQSNPANPYSLSLNAVGAFSEDKAGMMWVGTWGGGLDRFDPEMGVFSHYRHNAEDPNSLGSDLVMSIFTARDGRLWIGSLDSGLTVFDPSSNQFDHLHFDPADPGSLPDNSVNSTVQDENGDLWVATLGGLARYDHASGQFRRYQNDLDNPASLSENKTVSLLLDNRERLWVGTWGGGLNLLDLTLAENMDPSTAHFTRYLSDPNDPTSLSENSVWVLYEDPAGILWAGTQGGLNRFDPEMGVFQAYRESDGLPNDTILGILPDDSGHLWISTNNGLARLDPSTEKFRVYTVEDGLQSNEFDSGAYFRAKDGRLYFGGIDGFNSFYPDQVRDNPVPPQVAITSLSVFNQPVQVNLNVQEPVKLSYQQNFIAFEFAALDFHAPEQNRYAYMLEGLDPDWVQAGNRRYTSYTNLRGGQYTFRVKAANNDGVWNTEGVSLVVTVTPPFWDTLWFRGLGILMVVGLLVGSFQFRLWTVRNQNSELEQRVALRTRELQQEIEQREKAEQALANQAALSAVTSERNRLARELHDAVTQTLFSASLIAEVLPELWKSNPPEAGRRLAELRTLTRGALAEMRTLLVELRPNALVEVPLPELLRHLAEGVTGRSLIPIRLEIEGRGSLPPDIQVTFYRIAQEALNNIVKHAHAEEVTIHLQFGNCLRLSILDDGIGFDPASIPPDHLGLKIMRERAEAVGAKLAIYSAPGEGSVISVLWEGCAEEPGGKP